MIEGIVEFMRARAIAVAESRVIGGNQMKAIGKIADEVPKHVGGRRKTVQQDDRRRFRRAGLPVKNVDTRNGYSVVSGHFLLLVFVYSQVYRCTAFRLTLKYKD